MRRLSELWRELHVELDKKEDPFRESDQAKIEFAEANIPLHAALRRILDPLGLKVLP